MIEKKVKLIRVLDFVTLEATEVSTQATSNRVIVDTYLSDQLSLVCQYLTGTSETNNNVYIKVWGYIGNLPYTPKSAYGDSESSGIAADTDNWIQVGTYDISSGTAIFTASTFKIAGASGATTYDAYFALGITFPKIRVSAYEDGVSSTKGRLTVHILIQ